MLFIRGISAIAAGLCQTAIQRKVVADAIRCITDTQSGKHADTDRQTCCMQLLLVSLLLELQAPLLYLCHMSFTLLPQALTVSQKLPPAHAPADVCSPHACRCQPKSQQLRAGLSYQGRVPGLIMHTGTLLSSHCCLWHVQLVVHGQRNTGYPQYLLCAVT